MTPATITVTTFNNTVDAPSATTDTIAQLRASPGGDGKISLREAIYAANNTGELNTIILPAGTYNVSAANADNTNAGPNALPASSRNELRPEWHCLTIANHIASLYNAMTYTEMAHLVYESIFIARPLAA